MRKIISLFMILVFGCVGAQIKVTPDKITKIRKIVVVPMESRPLTVLPFTSTADLYGTSAILFTAPSQSLQMAGLVGFVVSGIYMLAELPEATKRSAKIADSVDMMLESGEVWIPTVVFARETAKQITAQGKHDVTIMQNVQKFPGVENRERTFSMENWLAPIRRWYNEETSQFDYKALKNQNFDAVLEVGVSNYSIATDMIVLQVHLKLIDPLTGQVLGRARDAGYPRTKTNGIFENDGKRFKEEFSTLGSQLIAKSLANIGLIPE